MWYTAYISHTRAKRKDVYFMCNSSNKLENLLSNSKIGEMLAETKLSELIKKKEDPLEEKKHSLMFFLAIIGAIAAVAVIAYAVYRYVTPDYMEEFDDVDDDLDDDLDFDDAEADADDMTEDLKESAAEAVE